VSVAAVHVERAQSRLLGNVFKANGSWFDSRCLQRGGPGCLSCKNGSKDENSCERQDRREPCASAKQDHGDILN
jgi:hypothetical protein